MTQKRILLLGYYGKGNFGDDVLLKVTYELLRCAVPEASISVIVDGDGKNYVRNLLGNVNVLKPARHRHFDLIVHGGGGVFFDAKHYGFFNRLIERIIPIFGLRNYLLLEKIIRHILHKSRTSATHRIGLGIGVGTFSSGSKKLREKAAALSEMSALWVRDSESLANLMRFASVMRGEQILGSDLAFLTEYWLDNVVTKTKSSRPRLGIVLRDWPQTDWNTLAEMLGQLSIDYEITGFVFDQHTDPKLQVLLAPYANHVWRPETMHILEFAQLLSDQDVLLTSRAHGAICGACLGVPSVIVNIEKKLEQVHNMLPNSSILVGSNDVANWPAAIKKSLAIPRDIVQVDVAKNRSSSEAALKKMECCFQ